jgi:hypothetical protein
MITRRLNRAKGAEWKQKGVRGSGDNVDALPRGRACAKIGMSTNVRKPARLFETTE